MPTVGADLDRIQDLLGDDGDLWPREELLRWYQDAYREFLARSRAARRLTAFDTPARVAWGTTYDWEVQSAPGTARKVTRTVAGTQMEATYLWEAEVGAGLTGTNSADAVTYPWEISLAGITTDEPVRVAFPRSHQGLLRLEWQDRALEPITVRDLDALETAWEWQAGTPQAWTPGTGPVGTVQVYEVDDTYRQAYAIRGDQPGLLRRATGTRTYAVGSTSARGVLRRVVSSARQYWPVIDEAPTGYGLVRQARSSDDAFFAIEVVIPTVTLGEADTPGLIPAPWQKYVRYGVLARARGRAGEGYSSIDRDHWLRRFNRGVMLAAALADVGFADRTWTREPAEARPGRPPRVQLPSTFPRVL